MSLTGVVSRWLRNEPTGSITTWDGLKTKFLNKYCPPTRTAKKMEEINNFQQEPDENLYQACERFKELLMKYPQHYLTEIQEVILFYNGLGIPTRQILDSRGAIPSKTIADAKLYKHNSIIVEERSKKVNESHVAQSDANYAKDPHYTKVLSTQRDRREKPIEKLTTRHLKGSYGPQFSEAYSEASHINKSIPKKEKDPGSFTLPYFINNVCFDNALVDLRASVSVFYCFFDLTLNVGLGELAHTKLTIELVDGIVKYPKGIAENVLVEDHFCVPPIAKIVVYKRKITLRIGEERIIFESVKPASSLIKRVYMQSLRERMELDLEARLMGDTLVINRSLDPLNGDHIELNDLNVPLELKRNQVDDLMPIKEGEVIEEFRTRNDELDTEIDDYPNKIVYKGNSVIGALMNVPIFVETFSYVTDFVVLENMDAYHDEVMGDVIFGKPFLREVGIKTRRFEGMITIYNGNDEVTYQMVRSHLRFKTSTLLAICIHIPPLLKLSNDDRKNGISHPYQKLKGFYKGVLNLGPNYIQDARMKEWLTRGHISVHEME
ncbi:hypothetical protein Tco_1330257 [Tanacetum coccineum]